MKPMTDLRTVGWLCYRQGCLPKCHQTYTGGPAVQALTHCSICGTKQDMVFVKHKVSYGDRTIRLKCSHDQCASKGVMWSLSSDRLCHRSERLCCIWCGGSRNVEIIDRRRQPNGECALCEEGDDESEGEGDDEEADEANEGT